MNKISRALSAIESINKYFYIFAAICLWSLFVLMTCDVLGRFLFNSPITGAIEVGTYLLAALAFLGLGYALFKGKHVKLDIITMRFPKKVRKIIVIAGLLLSAAFFAMMTRQTFLVGYQDWQIKNIFPGAAVNLPVWLVSFAATVGCALITIALLVQVTQLLFGAEKTEQK